MLPKRVIGWLRLRMLVGHLDSLGEKKEWGRRESAS